MWPARAQCGAGPFRPALDAATPPTAQRWTFCRRAARLVHGPRGTDSSGHRRLDGHRARQRDRAGAPRRCGCWPRGSRPTAGRDRASLRRARPGRRPEPLRRCLEQVLAWAGEVDLLVNNAGFGRFESLAAIDPHARSTCSSSTWRRPSAHGGAGPGDGPPRARSFVNVASIAGLSASPTKPRTRRQGGPHRLLGKRPLRARRHRCGRHPRGADVVKTSFFARRGLAYERRFPRPVAPGGWPRPS